MGIRERAILQIPIEFFFFLYTKSLTAGRGRTAWMETVGWMTDSFTFSEL